MKHTISIDIGGTNTRVSLVSATLEIVRKTVFSTNASEPNQTIEMIKEAIDTFGEEALAIGISCPGPLDLINGVVLTPPNLSGWHNYELKNELKRVTGLNVYVENDANLAALAEAVIGSGKDNKVVQYMTISTGIGGGLIIDRKIHKGVHGFAQEIANVIVVPNGDSVNGLKPGALEGISSGTGITYHAQKLGLDVNHAGDVNGLAMQGNSDAIGVMNDAKKYLANAIAASYAYIDPNVVVLGGSVALKIDGFVEELETLVKTKVYDVVAPYVSIRKAKLGDDSGLIGGAILAFQEEHYPYCLESL